MRSWLKKGSNSSVTHTTGTFCFAELVSPDATAATQFYGDLFGWAAEEIPGSPHSYWLFHLDGEVVAGLRPIRRGRQRWIPYVAVDRVDSAIAEAERLGGRTSDAPFDVSGVSRMATVVDPHERLIGLWEANGRRGADRQELPGSLWWVEMLAHDVRGATHFYSRLFGWNASERTFGHLTHGYTYYTIGNESVAGAIRIQENWGRVPERWQIIFAVADLDRTLDQTHGLGGSDELAPIEIPKVGRSAGLRDDRGGLFFAMQPQSGG